jgi:lipoprotein-releasing system ATP-binding protein
MELQMGERLAIVGASGSGKSTFLHALTGLEPADSGTVLWQGKNMLELKEVERDVWRNTRLGFVYQFHHLLPEFSALENVVMPLLIRRMDFSKAAEQGRYWLQRVGLKDRDQHLPSQLSGGERQRVALARALVHRPQCVLADEPTGNLDRDNARHVFALILQLAKEEGVSFLIVSHDLDMAAQCDRILSLKEEGLVEHRAVLSGTVAL